MLDDLSPRELSALYKDLLEYVQPKLARQEHTDGNGEPLVITVRHSMEKPPLLVQDRIYESDKIRAINIENKNSKPF
jgi:hypothetical protein